MGVYLRTDVVGPIIIICLSRVLKVTFPSPSMAFLAFFVDLKCKKAVEKLIR